MAEEIVSAGMVSSICIDWRKKEILLVLNADPEKPQNYWGLPGGKMKAGETPEVAIVRELSQETNQDGKATKHSVEIKKNGPKGEYIHNFFFLRIVSDGKELKNHEDARAIPIWIPFQAIFSGKVKMFRSHVQGLVLILEKMTEQKNSDEKTNKHGIKIISEGPSALLETLNEFKNSFDGKGQYIITHFNRRR